MENEKLINKPSQNESTGKSYGFSIAVAAKKSEKESLMSSPKKETMDGTSEKLTLLQISSNSPGKNVIATKNDPTNVSETVDGQDAQKIESKINDDIKDGTTSPTETTNGVSQRKNLKLQLNVAEAAKLNMKFRTITPTSLTPGSQGTPRPMKVAVFLKEGGCQCLLLEKGKITTAGELKSMMLDNLCIPKSCSRLFAIWFISPYLEIQLKDHHVPYVLRKQWRHLLTSFSTCQDPLDAVNDEPILMFQRNSFLTTEEESKYDDDTVVKRLFVEARHNILYARYPIPVADAEMLGGLLLRIEEGPYQAEKHKPGCFRKKLSKYLPYYAIGTNKITQFMKASGSENRLLQQYEHASNKADDARDCQRKFLEYCRSLPFYGCAFFKGKIAQEKLGRFSEKQIMIGINRQGVSIFRSTKEELLLYLSFDDLSWDFLKDSSEECLDTFCIEYDTLHETNEPVPQQIHILSKQACMMDAMVESCVRYMDIMQIPITPTSADHRKPLDISYSTNSSSLKKHNFTLSRPFKR